MWIATFGGLNRFDGYTIKTYTNDPADLTSISRNHIEDMLLDNQDPNIFWLATPLGLNKFDRRTETFTRYLHDPDDPHTLSENSVMRLVQEPNGMLWIATWEAGINRLNPATDEITRYPLPWDKELNGLRPTTRYPFPMAEEFDLRALYQDAAGILWLGTRWQGLTRFDP